MAYEEGTGVPNQTNLNASNLKQNSASPNNAQNSFNSAQNLRDQINASNPTNNQPGVSGTGNGDKIGLGNNGMSDKPDTGSKNGKGSSKGGSNNGGSKAGKTGSKAGKAAKGGNGAKGGAGAAKAGGKAGGAAAQTGGTAAKAGAAASTAFKAGAKAIMATVAQNHLATALMVSTLAVSTTGAAAIAIQYQTEDRNVKSGNYATEYVGQTNEEIKETWQGVFYQVYANRSVYAQVDLSAITGDGDKDLCPDNGNNTYPAKVGGDDGVDACSGETYQDLTGTDVKNIDSKKLYQEGTKTWGDLNIQDIGNKESYLGLSAGALAVLDYNLHEGKFYYPEQFIKPVYASCVDDFVNSKDKNKTIDLSKCKIQNTGKDGKPKEIKSEDDRVKEGVKQTDDPSLYLTYAKSTKFISSKAATDDGKKNTEVSSEESTSDKNNITVKKTDEKENGQWDYGLGTLAHYKAVYEPSRISDYKVVKTEYVCDGNGKTSSGIAISACDGKKFGDVVVEASSSGVDSSNLEKAYSAAYVPDSTLYYRDWHKNADIYNQDTKDQGKIYTSDTNGEYPAMGIPKEQWKTEPGISTGIPQTEVKFVIDKAITMAGVVNFKVSQDWVTQAPASHQQVIRTTTTNPTIERADKPYPELGGEHSTEVANYAVTRSLYHKEGKQWKAKTQGSSNIKTGTQLTWVNGPKTPIKESNLTPITDKKEAQKKAGKGVELYTYTVNRDITTGGGESTGYANKDASKPSASPGASADPGTITIPKGTKAYATVPAHYEDASGNVYFNGSAKGSNTDNNVLSQVPEGENKDDYQWGATVNADITIEKEGDLQTYVAKYNSSAPAVTDGSNLAYLKQYIHDYQTYVELDSDSNHDAEPYGVLDCYSSGKAHQNSDLEDYQKMADLRAGEELADFKFDISKTGGTTLKSGTDVFDDTNNICLSEKQYTSGKSLYLNNLPKGQFASMAGRLGFSKDDKGEKDASIVPVANRIKSDVGQAADKKLSNTLSKTDEAGNSVSDLVYTYASQYGVDPTLLGLIIAQHDAKDGNIAGMSAGTYKAYNISSRARTTEEMGGSSKSKDKQKKQSFLDSINFFNSNNKKLSKANGGSKVSARGLEKFTVTEDQLKNGAMLTQGGTASGLQDGTSLETVTDPSIFKTATITQDETETAKKIYELLSSQGINDVGIAAMLGNAQQESAMHTDSIEPQDRQPSMNNDQIRTLEKQRVYDRGYNGLGLWQWTDLSPGTGRATNLLNAADAQGRDWKEVEFQVGYLFQEGKTDSGLQGTIDRMKTATNVNAATKDWLNHWERGSDTAALSNRQTYANQWAEKIKNGELGARKASDSSSSDDNASNTDSLSNAVSIDNDTIIKKIDNKDYHWDPSDPCFGLNPSESGNTLLDTEKNSDKKLTQVDIYPMHKLPQKNADGSEWSQGAVVTSGGGLSKKNMPMVSSKDKSYTDETYVVPADNIHADWTEAGNGNSPLSIQLTSTLWLQTMPYTAKSRDSMRTKPEAYKHLIDNTPMTKEGFYLQLKDMIYLAAHSNDKTKFIIHSEDFEGTAPSVIAEATTKTISDSRKRSDGDVVNGKLIDVFTPEALSVKIAAMKLQGLQVKYDYNIPMVITAFGLGDDFMDAVLDVYKKQAGVDRDTAIQDHNDTAWADYRAEVFYNIDKYNVKLPDNATDGDTARTYNYTEDVLSRLQGTTLTYQKIDLRYDKSDDQVKAMSENENAKNDASKHTIGVWNLRDLHDSLANSNTSLAGNSAALLARAMRTLNKESGKDYITKDQWTYLTSGLIKYPKTYDFDNQDKYWSSDVSYTQIAPIVDNDMIAKIIRDMLRFGTDQKREEINLDNDQETKTLISMMFGNTELSSGWGGDYSISEIFGNEMPSFVSPTNAGDTTIRKFGYLTDTYGIRRYKTYTTYQDLTNKQVDVYGSINGKVINVGKNKEGYYTEIQIDAPKSKHILRYKYTRLANCALNIGDQVLFSTVIGKTTKDGVFGIEFSVDGEFADFDKIRGSLKQDKEEATADFTGQYSNANIQWPVNPSDSKPSTYTGFLDLSKGIDGVYHLGYDLNVKRGTAVYACIDGVFSGTFDGMGSGNEKQVWTVIRGTKYTVNYNHLSSIVVRPGQTVKKGDLIGYSGTAAGKDHLCMRICDAGWNPGDRVQSHFYTFTAVGLAEPQMNLCNQDGGSCLATADHLK